MATVTFQVAPTNTSTATFRTWGLAISNALETVGILKTSDTGQIDWTAVIPPGGASTYAGYEIRRFSDSLQSTTPWFFKIEYGSSSSGAASPGLRISIGSGSNGSGNITHSVNNTNVSNIALSCSSSSTTSFTCLVSGDGSYFTLSLFTEGSNTQMVMTAERTHDNTTGVDTADGLMFYVAPNYSSYQATYYYIPKNTIIPLGEGSGVFVPSSSSTNSTSGADGSNINFYPSFFFRGGTPLQSKCVINYFNVDVTAGNILSVPFKNTNYNYYFLGGTGSVMTYIARGYYGSTGAITFLNNIRHAILYQ